MAIEFARCVVYSRSQGKNAVRAAAYRSASRLWDDRLMQWHDYTRKPHVAHSEILLPEGADPAFLDRSFLWNQVEQAEKRSDSQLAKDYILALPKELSLEQNRELARQFAHDHFVRHGLVVDLNIHLEAGNPHAHLLVTTRRLLGKTFSLKARDLNPEFYKNRIVAQDFWGTAWRNFQNEYFKKYGLDLEVDPNHLVPAMHRGRKQDQRAGYIDAINTLAHDAEREIALADPASLLNILSQSHAVFNERELSCVIHKATDTPEEYQQAMSRIKVYPDLIALGHGDDGRMRYTTRQSATLEWEMEEQALKLASGFQHRIAAWWLEEQIKHYNLNSGQQAALRHVLLGNDLALVVGKAGTGKSYLMNAAREVWEAENYRVLGIAVAGIAAESLESGSGIQSSTIASFKLRLESGRLRLSDQDILVLDEAGMADNRDLSFIIRQVKAAGAKLVLIGDPAQVQPVGTGAPFRALLEKLDFAELTAIQRQRRPEDKIATSLLSAGKAASAIDIYAYKGQVFLSETEQESVALLLSKWIHHIGSAGKDQIPRQMNETLILAHRNEDVNMINQKIRAELIRQGMLTGQSHTIQTSQGQLDLIPGERILFLENNNKLNVKNGHFATVKAISGSVITALIGTGNQAREIVFDTTEYRNFTYGYAATIHKTQGVTVDNAFLYAGGKYWSRNLTYVGLSRHRYNAYLFADKETHTDFETLKKHLGRLSIKDAVIDFPLGYALRRGMEPETVLDHCLNKLSQVRNKIKDKWLFLANIEAFNHKLEQEQKQALRDQARLQRRQDAVTVAEYADLCHAAGKGFAHMKQSLKPEQNLTEHESFSAIYNLMIDRNRLAYQIDQETSRYELALELNHVEINDLQRYSKQHEARERVLAYEQAVRQGGRLTAGKATASIITEGKAHGLYLRERGLNWNAVYELAKEYRKRELYHKLTPQEKILYQDITRYQILNRASAQAWERTFTGQNKQKLDQWQKPEIFAEKNEHKIKIAKGFSRERDALACKIQENSAAYEFFLEHFKINRHRLKKAAEHYQKVQESKEIKQGQTQAPSYQVIDHQIRLSAPLLEKVSQYLEARQALREHRFSSTRQEAENLQYERAKALQREVQLWDQAKMLVPDEKIRLVDPVALREQIKQNIFMPESLKALGRDIGLGIEDHEYKAQKAEEQRQAEAARPKPQFQVVDGEIRLNQPLLEQVEQFVHLTEQIDTQHAEIVSMIMAKDRSEKYRQLNESMSKAKNEQRILSAELMKQEELWKTINTMQDKFAFLGEFKVDALKANIKYKSFDAENLHHLNLEAKGIIRSHEERQQQHLGRGRSR